MTAVEDWAEVGARVREARLAVGWDQSQLAQKLGIDRTSVVRIESGERRVSALELYRLAEALQVPLAHFVTRSPAAVVTRRAPLTEDVDAAARATYRLDAQLEQHARDAAWLVSAGYLAPPPPFPTVHRVASREEAAALARRARRSIGQESGPLGPMADIAEQFGLYLAVIDADVEGASLWTDGYGVALLGGAAEPGRRRFTAAHELGHHLLQDAYHSDVGIAASRDEREGLIDAFASEFLLPSADLRSVIAAERTWDRAALVQLSGEYRVSWSVALASAQRAALITSDELDRLRADQPLRGDFVRIVGREPLPDLTPGTTGAAWKRAVLHAYEDGAITRERAVELLRGALSVQDLPSPDGRAW